MPACSPRKLLRSTSLAVGTGVLTRAMPRVWGEPRGANDAVRVGILGLGRKGGDHLENLLKLPDVRLAAVCDVDPRVLPERVESVRQH